MNKYQNVFSPFRFGKVEVKNRIETPPMLPCLATPDGFVTREMIEFYRSFARGGAGIVTIGDSAVDFDYAPGHFAMLNLGDDRVIGGLSTMAEAIKAAEAGLAAYSAGEANIPIRTPVGAAGGIGLFMPGLIESYGALGIKIVSIFSGNVTRGLPTVTAVMVLNDIETGEPIAAMEAGYLTALRTGAAAGVAAKHLARRDSHALVIFGAGAQARTQLLGIAAVRSISRVDVFDVNGTAAKGFASEMGAETGLTIAWGVSGTNPPDPDHVAAAVAAADVIITATTSKTPVFDGLLIKPGTHVTAIGAYTPEMQELDEYLVSHADLFFCDTKEGAWAEAGDLLKPLNAGIITRERVTGEVGELVLGRVAGRTNDQQITVYKGVGLAALDLVVAKLV